MRLGDGGHLQDLGHVLFVVSELSVQSLHKARPVLVTGIGDGLDGAFRNLGKQVGFEIGAPVVHRERVRVGGSDEGDCTSPVLYISLVVAVTLSSRPMSKSKCAKTSCAASTFSDYSGRNAPSQCQVLLFIGVVPTYFRVDRAPSVRCGERKTSRQRSRDPILIVMQCSKSITPIDCCYSGY